MAVFLRGKVHELIFNLVDHCFSLRAIAVLEEGLQDAAAVVLVEQVVPLVADLSEAVVNDRVALRIARLLHHELVVV